MEVVYDLKGSGLTYKTATNLAVFPKNSDEDVEECAKTLNLNLNDRFVFINNP